MNHGVKITLFYTVMFITLGVFWFWMAKPSTSLPLLDPHVKLQCLSYAPFGKDESPMDFDKGLKLSRERIDKDLELLARYTGCIRTYSTLGLEMIPELARKHGLKMWLGAWVSADATLTQKEISAMIALAKQNADIIETVVVGNEALLRREVSSAQLVTYIQQVKKELPSLSVTYADVWEFWIQHPDIAPSVDRVTIHILPYWEDKPIGVDKALLHVKAIREEMMHKIQDKEIVIGETGWPSVGRMRESAMPSSVNQAMFTRGFVKMAEENGWKYNFIEAFDQPWKRISEGAVGGYWGLFDADRNDKRVLHGFVSNFPNALWLFVGSFALTLVGLFYLFREETCSCKKSPYLFITLLGGAVALTWQANSYLLTSRGALEYAWGFVCLALSLYWWIRLIRFLILEEMLERGSMAQGVGVLLRYTTMSKAHIPSLVHLLSVSVVLVMALGMAFDGRYHNFELGTLGVLTAAYFTFFITHCGEKTNGILEKIAGLSLFISALFVLLHESARNDFALNWVVMVLLFGSSLWVSKAKMCGLYKPLLVLVASGLLFVLLKEGVYVKEALIDTCAANPSLSICQLRSLLGTLIYLNIAGLSGLGVAFLALIARSYALALGAMVIGLFCLLTFNGFIGAIIIVLGWWVVGYKLGDKCTL